MHLNSTYSSNNVLMLDIGVLFNFFVDYLYLKGSAKSKTRIM